METKFTADFDRNNIEKTNFTTDPDRNNMETNKVYRGSWQE